MLYLPSAVNASGFVAQTFAPYRAAIDAILDAVTGDPGAVRRAEAQYRSGATASVQVASNVADTSSTLARSWQGTASEAYAGASDDLTGRLDHVRLTLNRQADAMARVADAQVRARAGVEQVRSGLDTVERSYLAASQSVPPAAVQPLLNQANNVGATFYRAATTHKGSLARVMSEMTSELNAATVAQRRQRSQRRGRPPAKKAAPPPDPWAGKPPGSHGGTGRNRYVVYQDEIRVGGSRAWRNNNPGNLTYGDRAKRLGATGSDGRFAIFPTRAAGEAAQRALINEQWNNETIHDMFYGRQHTVQGRRGPRVVVDLPGYAPAGENDTAGYLRHIRENTGIDVDRTRINQLTPAQLDSLVGAIHSYEGLGEGRVVKRTP